MQLNLNINKKEIIKNNIICRIFYMIYMISPKNKKKFIAKFYTFEGIVVSSFYNNVKSYIILKINKKRDIFIYRKFYIYSKNIVHIIYKNNINYK